ncbi:GNAT family N-acetyltransferase [Enterococcus hirae]|uniref:GNAT family N-acetyltransferase n=1 Tax=Enterococcus hirae TaxID=1354 RepID=UPI0015F29300|nr:GNAT family N-acetyltransferase [Enterococcus hirae]MBA5259352.1 GNAT family N-acetyltransferase [Enterococcus hirae]
MKVFITRQLQPDTKQTIRELKEQIEQQRHCQFKLAPDFAEQTNDQIRHVLCFKEETLIAYAFLSFYDESELEVTMIVHENLACLQQLLDEMMGFAQTIGRTTILYITDPHDLFLKNYIESKKELNKQFAEYRLILQPNKFKQLDSPYRPQKATLKESSLIAQLQLGEIGATVPPLSSEDLEKTVVFHKENQLIACARIEEDLSSYGIYGLVVAPVFRGQGLGKLCLNRLIQELLIKEEKEIYLEVDATNQIAYDLYVNMGFEKKSTFDYYVCQLTKY